MDFFFTFFFKLTIFLYFFCKLTIFLYFFLKLTIGMKVISEKMIASPISLFEKLMKAVIQKI